MKGLMARHTAGTDHNKNLFQQKWPEVTLTCSCNSISNFRTSNYLSTMSEACLRMLEAFLGHWDIDNRSLQSQQWTTLRQLPETKHVIIDQWTKIILFDPAINLKYPLLRNFISISCHSLSLCFNTVWIFIPHFLSCLIAHFMYPLMVMYVINREPRLIIMAIRYIFHLCITHSAVSP